MISADTLRLRRVFEIACSLLRRPGFAGLLASNFTLGLAYAFVLPYISLWGTIEVGMSARVFGLFMTVTALAAVVLSTVLAAWSDSHVTRRTMLIFGALGGVVGYAGYAFLRSPILLTIVGSIALGVASISFSQIFAYGREELERPENANADTPLLMSILRVAFSLAWTVGPALGAVVMVHFHYRGIFLAAAGLFLLFFFGVVRYVHHRPHPPAAHRPPRVPVMHVLRRPVILAHFGGFVLLFAAFTMNLMNLPLLVTQRLGGSEGQVGLIFGIAPVVEMPLMIWFGRLAARGHQVALIRFGVLVGALYFLALTFAGAPWHIYPMQILSAISIAVTTNVAITFFQDLIPGQPGIATTIYSNSFSAGSLVGYFAFGELVGSIGYRGIFWLCTALSFVTLVIFTAYRHGPSTSSEATVPSSA